MEMFIYTWNPILGLYVAPATGIIATTYVCDYICEETNPQGKLCIDKEKYKGDGFAAQADPFNCIKNANSSQNVYIDAQCTQSYSDDILQIIIDADPNGAFYSCDKGK